MFKPCPSCDILLTHMANWLPISITRNDNARELTSVKLRGFSNFYLTISIIQLIYFFLHPIIPFSFKPCNSLQPNLNGVSSPFMSMTSFTLLPLSSMTKLSLQQISLHASNSKQPFFILFNNPSPSTSKAYLIIT